MRSKIYKYVYYFVRVHKKSLREFKFSLLLSQFKTSILIEFLTLGKVRERLVTLLLDRSPQKSVKQALVGS